MNHPPTTSVSCPPSIKNINAGSQAVRKPHTQRAGSYTLDKAKLQEPDQCIAELNRRYAVVKHGGRTLILDEGGHTLDFLNFRCFENLYANVHVPAGKHSVRVAKYWIEHPDRRQYLDGIAFCPEGNISADTYNLWRGFAVEADPTANCELFIAHLKEVICGGDANCYEYFFNWLALMIQRPWVLPGVAIVLRSDQGTGKGLLMQYLGKMLGSHYKAVTGMKHLVGQFSGHLEDAVLVFADEVAWDGSKADAGTLKGMITEPTRMLERKYADALPVRNCVHVVIASNEQLVVPAEMSDRRYCMVDVSNDRIGAAEYFEKLVQEMEGKGPAALLSLLQSHDILQYNPAKFPVTQAKIDQQLEFLDPVETWLLEIVETGEAISGSANDCGSWPDRIPKRELYNEFITWFNRRHLKVQVPTQARFTKTLKVHGFEDVKAKVFNSGKRTNGYALPSPEVIKHSVKKRLNVVSELEVAA